MSKENEFDCCFCECYSCKDIDCKENNHCRGCHEYSQKDHMVELGSCSRCDR